MVLENIIMNINKQARLIAYYLPQYHPTPENDGWWGKGFTEWTNVAKMKPLFRGHYQPRLPADLGFYDLRIPEVRQQQADLAVHAGIEGFCYWHYWFGNGKTILERPFQEVLGSGQPNFPFCLGWANDSWTGVWHGCPGRTLLEQTYPGVGDERRHFYKLLRAFNDERYIKIDGKPLFVIYRPHLLPDPKRFIEHWNVLAIKEGLEGIYFVGNTDFSDWVPGRDGFDAYTLHNPGYTFYHGFGFSRGIRPRVVLFQRFFKKNVKKIPNFYVGKPYVLEYAEYIQKEFQRIENESLFFPCVVPNWDNTARCGMDGVVLKNSSPLLFGKELDSCMKHIEHRDFDKRIIFVKSWNEWAEGNYLEPDSVFGSKYLNVCRKFVFKT
jgi:lipopolysaccharide biosynthesis protein